METVSFLECYEETGQNPPFLSSAFTSNNSKALKTCATMVVSTPKRRKNPSTIHNSGLNIGISSPILPSGQSSTEDKFPPDNQLRNVQHIANQLRTIPSKTNSENDLENEQLEELTTQPLLQIQSTQPSLAHTQFLTPDSKSRAKYNLRANTSASLSAKAPKTGFTDWSAVGQLDNRDTELSDMMFSFEDSSEYDPAIDADFETSTAEAAPTIVLSSNFSPAASRSVKARKPASKTNRKPFFFSPKASNNLLKPSPPTLNFHGNRKAGTGSIFNPTKASRDKSKNALSSELDFNADSDSETGSGYSDRSNISSQSSISSTRGSRLHGHYHESSSDYAPSSKLNPFSRHDQGANSSSNSGSSFNSNHGSELKGPVDTKPFFLETKQKPHSDNPLSIIDSVKDNNQLDDSYNKVSQKEGQSLKLSYRSQLKNKTHEDSTIRISRYLDKAKSDQNVDTSFKLYQYYNQAVESISRTNPQYDDFVSNQIESVRNLAKLQLGVYKSLENKIPRTNEKWDKIKKWPSHDYFKLHGFQKMHSAISEGVSIRTDTFRDPYGGYDYDPRERLAYESMLLNNSLHDKIKQRPSSNSFSQPVLKTSLDSFPTVSGVSQDRYLRLKNPPLKDYDLLSKAHNVNFKINTLKNNLMRAWDDSDCINEETETETETDSESDSESETESESEPYFQEESQPQPEPQPQSEPQLQLESQPQPERQQHADSMLQQNPKSKSLHQQQQQQQQSELLNLPCFAEIIKGFEKNESPAFSPPVYNFTELKAEKLASTKNRMKPDLSYFDFHQPIDRVHKHLNDIKAYLKLKALHDEKKAKTREKFYQMLATKSLSQQRFKRNIIKTSTKKDNVISSSQNQSTSRNQTKNQVYGFSSFKSATKRKVNIDSNSEYLSSSSVYSDGGSNSNSISNSEAENDSNRKSSGKCGSESDNESHRNSDGVSRSSRSSSSSGVSYGNESLEMDGSDTSLGGLTMSKKHLIVNKNKGIGIKRNATGGLSSSDGSDFDEQDQDIFYSSDDFEWIDDDNDIVYSNDFQYLGYSDPFNSRIGNTQHSLKSLAIKKEILEKTSSTPTHHPTKREKRGLELGQMAVASTHNIRQLSYNKCSTRSAKKLKLTPQGFECLVRKRLASRSLNNYQKVYSKIVTNRNAEILCSQNSTDKKAAQKYFDLNPRLRFELIQLSKSLQIVKGSTRLGSSSLLIGTKASYLSSKGLSDRPRNEYSASMPVHPFKTTGSLNRICSETIASEVILKLDKIISTVRYISKTKGQKMQRFDADPVSWMQVIKAAAFNGVPEPVVARSCHRLAHLFLPE